MPCRASTVSKRCIRQAVDILGGQQHGQHARAGQAFFDQLCRLVGGDGGCFAITAAVDLAYVLEYTNLHWHDVELFAGLFTDHMLAAPASTGQLVLGKFVDDFDYTANRLAMACACYRP